NGLSSRRLAALGAEVLASDFSTEMLAHAQRRRTRGPGRIAYRHVDATDEAQLLELGAAGPFNAALASMALMDMAESAPLMRALATLLKPEGAFVFSILHPAFNNPWTVQMEKTKAP